MAGWDAVFETRVFAWMPLWPLLGVALAREAESDAVEHARTMLDPTRQPMPPQLESALSSAVAVWDAGDERAVRSLFKQAATLANRDGYL